MSSAPSHDRTKKSIFNSSVQLISQIGSTPVFKFDLAMGKLIALVLIVGLVLVGAIFSVLVYSPLGNFVPIPNAALERQYGKQILVQEQQLVRLQLDVEALKDYNSQLRKALGEGATGDSATSHGTMSVIVDEQTGQGNGRAALDEHPAQNPGESKPQENDGVSMDEGAGSIDLSGPATVTTLTTSEAPGRALFPLMTPVDGVITQGFAPSLSHFGVDFAGKRGTPIIAPADGHVVFAGWTYDDGNMLIIAHEGGYLTVYKHNQSLLAMLQSKVKRGDPVALLGETGQTSLGPHLHFELWKDGTPKDPSAYFFSPVGVQ